MRWYTSIWDGFIITITVALTMIIALSLIVNIAIIIRTDEIVTEGSRKVPCFEGPPEDAPTGFQLTHDEYQNHNK